MRNDHYPKGSVANLIEADSVSQTTRAVLKKRLRTIKAIVPVFFVPDIFYVLKAVCKQLIPQSGLVNNVDLATLLDEKLKAGESKGWRYNKMPPDEQSFILGLTGINETAALLFDESFISLSPTEQNDVLKSVQTGTAQGKTWQQLPSNLFFEDLLAVLAELYYSHPLAKEEIGEVAFADAGGWEHIGLNQLDDREPRKLT